MPTTRIRPQRTAGRAPSVAVMDGGPRHGRAYRYKNPPRELVFQECVDGRWVTHLYRRVGTSGTFAFRGTDVRRSAAPRVLRDAVTALSCAASVLFLGYAIGTPAAHAAPADDWSIEHGYQVCADLNARPTTGGVMAVAARALADGLDPRQAGDAIGGSVAVYCPEFLPVLAAAAGDARQRVIA